MNSVKFSILIPSYGNASFLEQTIKSVLCQDYDNFEIIICEQGNESLKKFKEYDSRIRIIHLLRPSRYISRIELFNNASGDYVWFVDNDDKIVNGSLNFLNSIISSSFPDCVVFEKKNILKDSDLTDLKPPSCEDINVAFSDYLKETALKDLLCTNKFNSICCKVFKRKLRPVWIETDLHQSEDKLLNYSLYKVCDSIVKTNKILYLYYLNHGGWTKPFSISNLNDSIKSRKILLKLEPNFAMALIRDIFDRIIKYVLESETNEFDNSIDFDPAEFDPIALKRAIRCRKYFMYRLVMKKQYNCLRRFGGLFDWLHTSKLYFKDQLSSAKLKSNKWALLMLPLACFSVISPISLLSTSSKIQDTSTLITEDVNNNGFELITFAKKDSSSGTRPDFSTEYRNMNDQFNTYSRCMETFDPLKKGGLHITSFSESFDGEYNDIETVESQNLSFLTSPGIQIDPVTEIVDGEKTTVYRNAFYKFQFKYSGEEKGDVRRTHYSIYCALHQRQANDLIDKINSMYGKHIDEEQLISTFIKVSSADNSQTFVFKIFNIIKENSDYLDDYNNALGNFIFVNDHSFGNYELLNSYMMTNNSFENYYNIRTRTNMYRKLNFKILYGNDNQLSDRQIQIQRYLTSIMDTSISYSNILIALVAINFLGIIAFGILLNVKKIKSTDIFLIVSMLIPALPYVILKIVRAAIKSSSPFSHITSILFFAFILVYEILIVHRLVKNHYENRQI